MQLTELGLVNNILSDVNWPWVFFWIKVSVLTNQGSGSHDIYGRLGSDFRMKGSPWLGLVTWRPSKFFQLLL